MDTKEVLADEELANNGIWIDYRDGAVFLIAYTGNKKYRNKLGKVSAKARRMNRGRDLDADQADKVMTESAFETVLLGWKGITKGGAEFPFNKENVEWLLTKAPDVRDFVFSEANNLLNFQKEGEPTETPLEATKSGAEVPAGTGETTPAAA